MKVYDIKPYEQRKPAFCAKVHISGRTNTIPKKVLSTIKASAKKIGRRNDLILFYFGKRQIDIIPSIEGDIMQQSRRIYTKSKINDFVREDNLSYNVFSDMVNESEIILGVANEYINSMRLLARELYK